MEFSQETMSLLFNKLNYESLPQNILASMVNDLSKQNKVLKEKLKAYTSTEEEFKRMEKRVEWAEGKYKDSKKHVELAEEELKDMEKQKNLAEDDFVNIKAELEKIILSKDNKIMELNAKHDREVRNKQEEINTLVKMTTKKEKKKTKEDEENNQENKIIHLQNFLKDYCKWTARRVNKWDICTKRTYELAPGSAEVLFDNFRTYCVANNIISDVCRRATNIPTKKEFMELIIQQHKETYPNDWCQTNKPYPQSPNGSYTTPRVNLILIKNPKTGEDLFKN